LPNTTIYLDESGDLGWTLDKPFMGGGSSQFLTIAALIVPGACNNDHPKRVVRRLYKKFKWQTDRERKWTLMKRHERVEFAQKAVKLKNRQPDISYCSITTRKENVENHIRTDSNKLYNYMIKLLLANRIKDFDNVTFVPDDRAIKVKSGNSLHDYLQMVLWFHLESKTILQTTPLDSASSLNVQFADMLAGAVQSHFEFGNSDPFNELGKSLDAKTLYF